jgi:regulator of replication initiation timing
MSGNGDNIFSRTDEFMTLFKRGADFSRELIEENERLREALVRFQDRQESAAQSPEDWEKLRQEMIERIQSLELECTTVRQRLDQVELENSQFAQRYLEIEEENNNLANLYVASYQLHSSLDPDEVLKIILEIAINLVGAEVFAIYLLNDETSELTAVAAEGRSIGDFPRVKLGSGVLGAAVASNEATCWNTNRSEDLSRPIVCVPLVVQDRTIGAIAVFGLLQQKDAFSPLDHELFNLLGGHAATALFAARLYSQSERKLNTIQGFIDLLTN